MLVQLATCNSAPRLAARLFSTTTSRHHQLQHQLYHRQSSISVSQSAIRRHHQHQYDICTPSPSLSSPSTSSRHSTSKRCFSRWTSILFTEAQVERSNPAAERYDPSKAPKDQDAEDLLSSLPTPKSSTSNAQQQQPQQQPQVQSMSQEIGDESELLITDNCAQRLLWVNAKRQGQKETFLRISVDGGGCSGFKYRFILDKEPREDDIVFVKQGAKVAMDPVSLGLMKGSMVDFAEEMAGAHFVVKNNPAAVGKCGCGSSFTPRD